MKFLALALSLMSLSTFAQVDKRVIGADSRQRVTARTFRPVHESIGLILMTYPDSLGMCTGTVVGPRHVITAAHCLTKKGKFAETVMFFPAMNNDLYASTAPYGSFKAIKLRVIKNYLTSKSTKDDLGLITFSENLPVAALPLAVLPANVLRITIAGYPGDKTEGTLWEASGTRSVTIFGGGTYEHEVDTMPGQSGAAVRATVRGVESIVAIHSAGVDNWIFRDNNLANFLTADLIKMVHSWMDQD